MLSYGALKNHAGILLIGDYTSLAWLHDLIHDANERSPTAGRKLRLCHAFQRYHQIVVHLPSHLG
ncbi:hypothetical protein GGQ66_001497 [Rhizobium borbori]|uniref:Uncharacterized protein n=1 Tax=Allorhizobium borbori TaxID=485907 RepID=A0A7W6K0M8_9HYPH|nr:hypothetical protein [Allorhizobium borbori]